MSQTTPDTLNFLYLSLGAVAVLTIGYIGSLWLRYRNLHKDVELIERLAEED